MPGAPRGLLTAGYYHATVRTAGPIAMFADDDDRTRYLKLLERDGGKLGVSIRMFCLMLTHVHLLLETHADNVLQPTMKSLNWSYAMWFNRRHDRSGHLFGRRYWCKPVETTGQLLNAARYIARNPVRAGICAQPEDWHWGSYRQSIGLNDAFTFVDDEPLLAEFGTDRGSAITELAAFVAV